MAFEVPTGTVLARFRVVSPIGDGAMGTVYLAEGPDGGRVALKVLAPELARDERFRRRFLQESQLASSLDHPHIVPTLTSGEEGGLLYLVMAHVEGSDLRRILRAEGALEPARALGLVSQVAEALDAAHEAGLVHRDVKPANVLVADESGGEHAYVCDFGLARHVSSVGSLTGDRGFVGTIDYVSPEQIEGGPIDRRADVYSLACVLYECLGGARPFERESELSVVFAHLVELPPPVTDLRPELPPALNDVFGTALAKSPDDRYGTCSDLVDAASAALRGKSPRRPRRRPRILVGAVVIAAAAGAGLGLLLSSGGTSRPSMPSRTLAVRPDSVALVGARSPRVVSTASFHSAPSDVAVGSRSAWVLLPDQQLVARVDPKSGKVAGRINLHFVPSRIAAAGRTTWVTEESGPHIAEVAVGLGGKLRLAKVLSVPTVGPRLSTPAGIAFGAGSLWIARGAHLARVDPRTGRVVKLFSTPVTSNWVVFAGGSVWAAGGDSGLVVKIDPISGAVTRQHLHGWISDLAVGGGFVWVPVVPANVVYKLSVDNLSVQGQVPGGADPESVSVGGGSLWIANTTGGTITRLDLATGARTATTVPSAPQSVRYHDGVVWTAAAPLPPRLAPIASGQEIRIPLSRDDFDSLDPALAHDADRWQRDYATCATLLNYPDSAGAAGRQLRPEIAAAMPAISADGRTYTFRIRPGFRFSPPSGRPVTAETFRYTLERAFSPKYGGGSPAMQLLSSIVGSTAYNRGKARHISGISVRGNALSITLAAPVGAFASRLSEAFFCPVPIGTPAVPGGLTRPIPSAGPYYVASSAPGQTVLLRNPYYDGPRPRRIERIVYTTGVPSAKAVALVDSGAAEFIDGNTTDTDPGLLATSSAAARNRERYVVVPAPAVDGVAFNTKRQLLRDVRIRRAVNLALDRRALAAVYDEQPIDDYIPPAIPGSRPGHVYPLGGDLAEAKRLAGTGRRHAVLYSCGEPETVSPGVDEIIRADLARIGIGVRIEKSLGCLSGPDTKKLAAADMALITSFDDWGDPAGTIRAAFGSAGQGRQGYWDDPALLRRVEQVERLRGAARIAEFSRLDATLVRDVAPLAVFGAFTVPEYFSPRVGCKIFQATYHFVDLGALCVRKAA